jgi:LysR family transcriptional regulator for bpeEF and oprC
MVMPRYDVGPAPDRSSTDYRDISLKTLDSVASVAEQLLFLGAGRAARTVHRKALIVENQGVINALVVTHPMKTPGRLVDATAAGARGLSFTAALRDLNKLNAFVRVAERKSFTKAAADLRTTPSVVSKHMKELEDALGFSLFNRSTHGIMLTDAGEGLFQNCLQMLATLDGYVVETRNLQKGPYGTLRIQTTGDYADCLTPLVSEFARRHPELRIQLSIATDASAAADEGFDVIVTTRKPSLPGLIDRDLGGIRQVICASPKYFQRFGRPRKPEDLREHSCLVNLLSAPKGWPFQNDARQFTVEVKGALSSNSAAVLVRMALEGHGIIRVPHYAVKAALADKTLQGILEGMTASPERVRAYFSKAKHLPAKTTDFIQFLQASIAAR